MKTYQAHRLGPGQLAVVCPNRACGGKFVVSPKWLRGHGRFRTAACPYCFKTAKRS